ncbi:keratin, type II cytoskeletal 2 epidermal-like [Jatropha curcas]|uniref:keratin, type II cytoskeletal 2 epidermal-like n=1 Tax=Jatropha curcas TaxID=180498 RepID=UPI0018948DE3|nr:keratin, type II cytoskeletal 2 epidermal-like [Jatropha curcas]
MCPSSVWGYLWWCILLGHFCTSILSLNSMQHRDGDVWSGNWLQNPGSVLSNDSRSGMSNYAQLMEFSFQLNTPVSCEDLGGVGSFNTTCLLNSNQRLNSDLYVYGTGNLEILPHVSIVCPIEGCMITFNMTGNVNIGRYAAILAGSVVFAAANLTMEHDSSINTTGLGGPPPPQTSGTPVGYDGAGGGHGGRGASCVKKNKTNNWGGDVYAWSSLAEPWSYGSRGGGTSPENKFGGNGGGRVKLLVNDMLYLNGSVTTEGGDGGMNGGGGSGGSIFIHAIKLKGYGTISAAGGRGKGGGGGGRISLDCYSIQEDVKVTVHGLF